MGEQGAALQGYNAALLEGLAELRARREELNGRIREEEAERGRLQARLGALSQRLARTNESLAGHLAARSDLDRSIAETEAAYGKPMSRRTPSPSTAFFHGHRRQNPNFYWRLGLRDTCLHLFSDHLMISTSSQECKNDLWDYNPAITFCYSCPPC
ncbi:microtubule nucleation factor SSNA1 isoform X1 [Cygnus atratus]|uniref:microtubule nucleation factor SSNA1 isoform X1 n=1 Tax=Cygnus atratus TaxID=8868 RepID=UPI0015D5DABC|nr:microtubule nucleation factor SSNA1 isoform X1 [Cygnus atratus]